MARPRNPHPKMVKDRSRGTATCWITDPATGKRRGVRLGPWGSASAEAKYARLLADLRAGTVKPKLPASGVTVADLCTRFGVHALAYYGRTSSEFAHYRLVVGHLDRVAGGEAAASFGPAALKSVRAEFVAAGWGRSYVNDQTRRVRSIFRWAVGEELVPTDTWVALKAVAGLGRGRTLAPEREPVKPAPLRDVAKALKVMPPAVAAMVRLQWLTGCRPQDACNLEPETVDRRGDVWMYYPRAHKGKWRGRVRTVYIGPKAQKFLAPWLEQCPKGSHVFRHRRGKYVTGIYCKAVLRSCLKAGVSPFSPGQLRHNAATRFRERFGLEMARVLLGHDLTSTSEIYAEKPRRLAAEAMKKAG